MRRNNRKLYDSIMKEISKIVKRHLNEGTNLNKYNYFPKTKKELKNIIKQKILDEGPNANLNDINVSEITDMSYLFVRIPNVGNIHIEDWDVSSVEDMSYMFSGRYKFNCDLSNWDVSSVEDMSYMFEFCKNFNCDLSNWDVSNVWNMNGIFYNTKLEKIGNLPSWLKNNVLCM